MFRGGEIQTNLRYVSESAAAAKLFFRHKSAPNLRKRFRLYNISPQPCFFHKMSNGNKFRKHTHDDMMSCPCCNFCATYIDMFALKNLSICSKDFMGSIYSFIILSQISICLLLISISFTPKTSHSCLKKRVLSYVFQVCIRPPALEDNSAATLSGLPRPRQTSTLTVTPQAFGLMRFIIASKWRAFWCPMLHECPVASFC